MRQFKNKLTENQINSLNTLEFKWEPKKELWYIAFSALKVFYKREGHCLVSVGHKEGEINLGRWVANQRVRKKDLNEEQLQCLNSLNFTWTARKDQWEQNFEALKLFFHREKHFKVPQDHIEGKLKLGRWVNKQRTRKSSLSEERVKKLNSIGFTWNLFKKRKDR